MRHVPMSHAAAGAGDPASYNDQGVPVEIRGTHSLEKEAHPLTYPHTFLVASHVPTLEEFSAAVLNPQHTA